MSIHTVVTEFSLVAGILASTLHVITGPDHLAAVTPFAVESRQSAWKIGLIWSFGHIAGMIAIGLAFLGFKDLVPIASISAYSEQLVGLVLVGVGLWSLYKIFASKYDIAISGHSQNKTFKTALHQSHSASFSIGFLHGVAGIAHILLLLPVLGFEEQRDSVLYLVGFSIGIALAMTIFTLVIGKIATFSKSGDNTLFFNGIRLAAGLFAIIIGIYWMVVS